VGSHEQTGRQEFGKTDGRDFEPVLAGCDAQQEMGDHGGDQLQADGILRTADLLRWPRRACSVGAAASSCTFRSAGMHGHAPRKKSCPFGTKMPSLPPSPAGVGRWQLLAVASAIAAMLAILIWPALWNGLPLIFSDTGGYLLRPFEGKLELGRSALYGTFLAAGLPLDFWPNIVAQAALTLFVLQATLRAHDLASPWLLLFVVAGLAAATGISFYVAQLIPDILLPLAVLSLHLLAFARERLGRPTQCAFVVIVAFAMASHMAILGLSAGLLGAFVIWRWAGRWLCLPRPALRWPVSAVAAGFALALLSNLAIAGQFAFTPGGPSFLFGRLIQDGIVARYLAERCPDASIRLCAYRDRVPRTADDWLWHYETPFWELGGPEGYEDEERRIIRETLMRYPLAHLGTALTSSLEQLFTLETSVATRPWDNEHTFFVLAQLHPDLASRVLDAPQQYAGAFDLAPLNRIHVPIAYAGMALLVVSIVLGARGIAPASTAALSLTVLLALLGNAAICGIVSNPVDRYQSRLVWLAPLCVAMTAIATRRAATRRRLGPADGLAQPDRAP
jgi:hypothetical protein